MDINVVGEPSDIKFTQGGMYAELNNYYKVLVVEIPDTVKPGSYDFNIGIKFEGTDFGTIPCTIEVVN